MLTDSDCYYRKYCLFFFCQMKNSLLFSAPKPFCLVYYVTYKYKWVFLICKIIRKIESSHFWLRIFKSILIELLKCNILLEFHCHFLGVAETYLHTHHIQQSMSNPIANICRCRLALYTGQFAHACWRICRAESANKTQFWRYVSHNKSTRFATILSCMHVYLLWITSRQRNCFVLANKLLAPPPA